MSNPIARIRRAIVPACMLQPAHGGRWAPTLRDDLAMVDLTLAEGRIAAIAPTSAPELAGPDEAGDADADRTLDLNGGMLVPGLIDCHTHLDKGHMWPRHENPDGTFASAMIAVDADRLGHWSAEDLRARAEFSLRCAYAYGTVALRTHLDSIGPQTDISWGVLDELRADWADRIALQMVSLSHIDIAGDPEQNAHTVARVAASGGVLGAGMSGPADVRPKIEALFRMAMDAGLALDLHVDENLDPESVTLRVIAETALKFGFDAPIQVGHCCSISVQEPDEVSRTLDLVAQAGIAVVSLPMCNMYLQDRVAGRTPRRRGVTIIQEMTARGILVSAASDNTRDPFYGYGDLDLVETWREVARIAQLDRPFGDWARLISANPATAMGLTDRGVLAEGGSADLIAFPGARTYSELFSRPQVDRIVLRAGQTIDQSLPDYRTLDPIVGAPW